jgi:hypothetical protein
MADGTLFEAVADAIQGPAGMDVLATRGTLRLPLKSAGLDPKSVTPTQMRVVIERLLRKDLERRGVTGARGICDTLVETVRCAEGTASEAGASSPEEIFRRMRERDR